MSELITVPTALISQGEILADDHWEIPIQAVYYADCISLEQEGIGSITLSNAHIRKVFKEVLKHIPEAESHFKSKK